MEEAGSLRPWPAMASSAMMAQVTGGPNHACL